jgi:hypothetical protein
MALTPEKVAALKQTHGEIWEVDFPSAGFSVAFKRPSAAAYERYVGTMANDKSKVITAARAMTFDVVVEPTGDALTALLDKFPGIVSKIASQASSVASAQEADDAKKH